MKEDRCGTCCMLIEEVFEKLVEDIAAMTPKERAQLRVELRKSSGLPAMPEPDLWIN